MKKPLKIAIIGCGGMGSGHARALGGLGTYTLPIHVRNNHRVGNIIEKDISGKLVLAGIYDIDPARMQWAADNGIHCFESYEDMLSDPDVDIILIALPNQLHKEYAIRAMRAGKHVLCEKPVMITSKDLEDVIAVSKETGRVFYPRQNRRWDMDYLMIKKIYDEGLIGEVFNVESRYMGSRGIPGDWRGKKECGGGMMLDWGVHLLDRIALMINEPITSVFSKFTHITNDECDDGFKTLLTFKSGKTALIEVGTCNYVNLPTWYIAGTTGSAVINDYTCEGKMMVLKEWHEDNVVPVLAGEGLTKTMAPRDEQTVEERDLPYIEVQRNALYENLADTINGEAEQIVKPEEALRILRLMEACFESDATGSVVSFE